MKKKMRTIILSLLLIVDVTPTFSQFYDVRIKKRATVINTYKEETPLGNAVSRPTAAPGENQPSSGVVAGGMPDPSTPPLGDADVPGEVPSLFGLKGSSSSYFCSPLDSLVVSSPYGYRSDPFTGKRRFHRGTDYVTHSENVYAIMPGRIAKIGYNKRLGNYITLDHGEVTVTYGHLHTVVGEKNDVVRAGQSVGLSGSTGRSTGEHLHVSMKYRKEWIDPDPILRYIQYYSRVSSDNDESR